jgi:anthranilate 1,2-dioxygenase large subunit
MLSAASAIDVSPSQFQWPPEGVTRDPYRLFTDRDIYQLEQQRIFRGRSWNFLGLDVEIPNVGDCKTTSVGETPVIVTRDKEGNIHAMVNRCAHKGALVYLKKRHNVANLACMYHARNYELDGRLKSVAFRNGVRGQGGMPVDFDVRRHRLQPLKVEIFCGMIFGTFAEDMEDVQAYLGPHMAAFIKRNLGRALRILGTHSQMIRNNWKLYAENLRDSDHTTLLHTFYTTFKVNRLDMDGGIVLSERKWHHISFARRAGLTEASEYKDSNVHAASYESALEGPGLLRAWEEFDDGITHSIETVFPNMCVQFTLNSLAIRFFAPRGVDKTVLFWICLGYTRDIDKQSQMRIMQSNLTGAVDLVSLEDGCINEFVQRGTRADPQSASFMEMGGRKVESEKNSRATESAVRGLWQGYREIMGY